ncbi:carbon monoxide dehydrogenase subunit G [Roseomonas terrae]|jgi:carbon monoxide dehydrogenase subunit G|uniref:Carbon monoxide dehydrogenase subunit G n=1 Tax=Neoroseomonas terrae TaxID=424799 RepID=A0ABS5ELE7_9PROT|nr:carbon monoxide dehydrogenase subunit G [Neoroseomonas terrae]MBR0651851.1 carbon monoxide dehydrogenase subunit G [Neoroseomonas terrae]
MDMSGERRISAPRQRVWDALNDPEMLRASIPGCESVTRTAEDAFEAKVSLKIGPMAAKFGGKVKLENINPPASYTITGEGNGGAMGFAKGGADVALEEIGPDETLLKYTVKAQVGGKMAQLGARLIDSTAKQMSDQFFDRFAAAVAPPAAAVEAEPEAVVAAAPAEARAAAASFAAPREAAPVIGSTHPAPTAPAGISIFDLLPEAPFGIPLLAWAGGAVWLVILALMFL